MIRRSESKSKRINGRRSSGSGSRRRLLMEGLEPRRLLNAAPVTPPGLNTQLNTFNGARNIGTVPAFQFNEAEPAGAFGRNDSTFTANFVPLGTGPGQQHTVDITGTLPFEPFGNLPLIQPPTSFISDLDVFAFDLRAGDILDLAALGAVGSIDITYGPGTSLAGLRWFGAEPNDPAPETPGDGTVLSNTLFYPSDSPLQTIGAINASQVVPETGRYYLTVSPGTITSNYTIGARVYRPVAESLPIGSQQIVFLDFDGAIVPRNVISNLGEEPQPGVFRIPSLFESLVDLGFEPLGVNNVTQLRAIENELIDKVLEEVELQFASIAKNGSNGDFDATGIPGQYGLTVLNSRDHGDPAAIDLSLNAITTRVLVGGINDDIEQGGLLGISSTIDIGNFSMDDIVFAVLDLVEAVATSFPISNAVSVLDSMARQIAITVTHEAAHSFGLWHTNGDNFIPSLVDGVGANVALFDSGVGPDGVFGTSDDTAIEFPFMDEFDLNEQVYFGHQRVADTLAHSIVTGTVGNSTSGRVFNDLNRNGSGTGDPGLAGVRVFVDLNGNGTFETNEPSTFSAADGTYSLRVPAGNVNLVAVTPTNFNATTATQVSVRSGATGVNFGFFQTIPDITGLAYVDVNGNGTQDVGETGQAGVFVYVDLDGDKRPDIGEPSATTDATGRYTLDFPGPGSYTICMVVPAGFEQTEPASGGHVVVFDGTSVSGNAFFGLLPSTDFGDAPASYGAASHGLVSGLTIGALIDREPANQPSLDARGDDNAGVDDEDGVQLTSPLGLGGTGNFNVTVTNTTGSTAFLQGFIDFDRDGSFTDPGEHFLVDAPVVNGTVGGVISVPVTVPATASIGDTFVRFRLSRSGSVGPTGFIGSGEVEDHAVAIFAAAEVANDDNLTVSRNSTGNRLEVLANDFETAQNPLSIDSLGTVGTSGSVTISNDRRAVIYTPPIGFVGLDSFTYTVEDLFGNRATATVNVSVLFQSSTPIAVDDTFEVPQGSSNRALNVLDNDLPSIFGGLTIVGVTAGSQGGFLTITGGGQSIRYTPPAGFNGTEQFTYTVQDNEGNNSAATVTVHLTPGSAADDIVAFSVQILDKMNLTPISSVPVGEDFLVRVLVDDLRPFATPPGVASAFLDVLYTDALVAVKNTGLNPARGFDIEYGPLFVENQRGDAQTPGLLDDAGALQRLQVSQQVPHTGPVELFTVTMQAVSPGTAVFQTDPADAQERETTVIGGDVGLTASELRFGRTDLLILPAAGAFTSAIDDAFPDGRDSNGMMISNATPQRARLDVLANDNLGQSSPGVPATIQQFGLVTNPSFGNAFIDNNGTPTNLSDDFISYRANAGANGLESFTYFIVADDGVTSTATVNIALGDLNDNAQVAIDFQLVSGDGSGTPISIANVGDRVGVQINIEDLRPVGTFVFAAYLDLLYPTEILRPATGPDPSLCTAGGGSLADELNFLACIGADYVEDAVSGSAARPGIIDEFGTLFGRLDGVGGDNPAELATIYFDVIGPGTARIIGSPADALPQRDTLLFEEDEPVPLDRIRYDVAELSVFGSGLQNFSFPQDVNGDGEATALDALIVINYINDEQAEGQAGGAASPRFFTDVNGDFEVTALDALQVINYLARRANGEAESQAVSQPNPVAIQSLPTEDSDAGDTDAAFSALAGETADPVVSFAAAGGQAPATASMINSVSSHQDDDDEDPLDLFADDVLGQWNS